jgi:hypothetical protein
VKYWCQSKSFLAIHWLCKVVGSICKIFFHSQHSR